jgi:hypothetical protein
MGQKSQDNKAKEKALVPQKGKNERVSAKEEIAYIPVIPLFSYPTYFEFKSPVVREIFDIKKERLRQWIRLGYITPSIKVSSGPGVENVFSGIDLFRIGLFIKLVEIGLNRWIASQFVRSVAKKDWDKANHSDTKYFLIVTGKIGRKRDWKKYIKLFTAKEVPKYTYRNEFTIVVNLVRILKEISKRC